MKHTSKENIDSKNLDNLNVSTDNSALSIKENENLHSLNDSTQKINNEQEQDFNEFTDYVSNAYYYTGKGSSLINIKAILSTILGIIVLIASTLLYLNDKSNFNIYIGATIGILLLIIALIQFTYKKN